MPEIVHSCGKKLSFPPGMEGRKGKCPNCGGIIEVPVGASQTAPPSSGNHPRLLPSSGTLPALPANPPGRPGLGAPSARQPTQKAGPAGPPPAHPFATIRSDRPRVGWRTELGPPPNWEQFQAFLEGKGPSPRPVVIPHKLMLRDDADAKWEASKNKAPPSKYACPGCKDRLGVGALVCMKCGLDLRSGRTLDGKTRLNEAGLDYLKQISWLKAEVEEFSPDGDDGDDKADAGGDDAGAGDEDDDDKGGKKPRFPNLRKPRRP